MSKQIKCPKYGHSVSVRNTPTIKSIGCSHCDWHETNYEPIRRLTNEILTEYYQMIENDLKKIINAPSTINKIFQYYKVVAWQFDSDHYLVFQYGDEVTIIKTYSMEKFLSDCQFRQMIEYELENCISFIPVDPILPGGY